MARALAVLERAPEGPQALALLDAAYDAPRAHVIGITGPPGVGKSTLIGAMIKALRTPGPEQRPANTVGVIAVDPSSRRSGGALLGDRVRLLTDPDDAGVFVRSMAARDRLGGLAEMTLAAMVVMRAVFDVVMIETVGVGQSETDVAGVADSVVFCIQPGSGDSLQFMKAGIAEIPDIAVVTKADMKGPAQRALADVKGALGLSESNGATRAMPILAVAAAAQQGIESLVQAIDAHMEWLQRDGGLPERRRRQAEAWLRESLKDRFGRRGLDALGKAGAGDLRLALTDSPFRRLQELSQVLDGRIGKAREGANEV